MRAQVAQRRSSEYRVGNGVREHIGIGVPDGSKFRSDVHAAENEPSSRRQAVRVEAMTDSRPTRGLHNAKTSWSASSTRRVRLQTVR